MDPVSAALPQNLRRIFVATLLRLNETNAIPRRLEAITEDVKKQTDREKDLQAKYREIVNKLEEARVGNFHDETTEKVDMDIGD